jgi:hypothetical protein
MLGAVPQDELSRASELQVRIWVDGPFRQPEQVNPLVRKRAAKMNRMALANGTWGEADAQPLHPLDPPPAQRLGEIHAPTLIMAGRLDDPEILRAAEVMAAAIPRAQKVIIPGNAHLPNMDMEKPGLADWPQYGRDQEGTRYTPLDQINRDNVAYLEIAWEYHTGDFSDGSDGRPETTFQATPILVDGVLYPATVYGRVTALDPETGAELWKYDPGIDATVKRGEFANRGVTYWHDADGVPGQRCERRIFVATVGCSAHCNAFMPNPDRIDQAFIAQANRVPSTAVELIRVLIGAHQSAVAIIVQSDWQAVHKFFPLSDKYAAWADYGTPP